MICRSGSSATGYSRHGIVLDALTLIVTPHFPLKVDNALLFRIARVAQLALALTGVAYELHATLALRRANKGLHHDCKTTVIALACIKL